MSNLPTKGKPFLVESNCGNARAIIRYNRAWEEWKVEFSRLGAVSGEWIEMPEATYFTSDRVDAHDTAVAEVMRMDAMHQSATPTCPVCGGGGGCLGVLGPVAHFRCIQCGWDWSEDVPEWALEDMR